MTFEPLNLWWISNKTIMEVGNNAKASTFKSFLHLRLQKHTITFFVKMLFNIFMRQTLTDDFWRYWFLIAVLNSLIWVCFQISKGIQSYNMHSNLISNKLSYAECLFLKVLILEPQSLVKSISDWIHVLYHI